MDAGSATGEDGGVGCRRGSRRWSRGSRGVGGRKEVGKRAGSVGKRLQVCERTDVAALDRLVKQLGSEFPRTLAICTCDGADVREGLLYLAFQQLVAEDVWTLRILVAPFFAGRAAAAAAAAAAT